MTNADIKISICELALDYFFTDPEICLKALSTHPGAVPWRHRILHNIRNDRPAVLGVALLRVLYCTRWHNSTLDKGQWSDIERDLLSNKKFACVGFEHGFDQAVILSPGTHIVSEKTMATTMQAILGAVFLDGGAEALDRVLDRLGLTHPLLQAASPIPAALELP